MCVCVCEGQAILLGQIKDCLKAARAAQSAFLTLFDCTLLSAGCNILLCTSCSFYFIICDDKMGVVLKLNKRFCLG